MTAEGLLDLILQSQGTDPLCTRLIMSLIQILQSQRTDLLCTRLKKELDTDSSREGYSLGQKSLLLYKKKNIAKHKLYSKLEFLPMPKGLQQKGSLDFITQLLSSYIGTKEYNTILQEYQTSASKFTVLFYKNTKLQYSSL